MGRAARIEGDLGMHHSSQSPAGRAGGLSPSKSSSADGLPDGRLPPTDGEAAASAELARHLTEDRDRIAHGISDVVIRRIFAAGLDLHAALALLGEHRATSKIWHAIDELDRAISDIRNTVFDGRRATHGPDADGRGR